MSDQFEAMLHALVLRVAPQWRQESERHITALRGAGGTSYERVLALAQDAAAMRVLCYTWSASPRPTRLSCQA